MNSRFLALAGVLVAGLITFDFVLFAKERGNPSQLTKAVLSKRAELPREVNAVTGGERTASAQQRERPDAPVQVLRFALYDAGIYPREARVVHGRVIISLVDYTGETEGLIVERGAGPAREQAGRVRRNGARWRGREELELSPGEYRLFDAGRPENTATLIVEP